MHPKSRWFRISLRTCLVLLAGFAIAFALFARYARERTTALDAIRKAGGSIRMDNRDPSRLEEWFGPNLFGIVNKVDLREGTANNELLSHIGVLKELKCLDLSDADIDDKGVRLISHLPLRELWLQNTKITDASAETLSEIESLDFLQLNATAVSDSFLEQLESLPALRDLGLRGTSVTGAGMKYLARHPNLKSVDVYRTDVDDSGVHHLAKCQSLTHIGLSKTKITNDVFEYLENLPLLTSADLTANRPISTKAVLAFEATHPNCDIEW